MEAGANLKLRNNDGETPYEVAFDDDLTRFKEFLKNKMLDKYAKKLTKKIRQRAMTNKVKKKVIQTLVRSHKIPSDLAQVIAEYGAGSGKRTRRRRPKKKRKKSKRR